MFNEAYDYTKELIDKNSNLLDEEERNLLMRSLKGKFNIYRTGWKNVVDFDSEIENVMIPKQVVEKTIEELEKNIQRFCMETIDLIENVLEVNKEDTVDCEIFYKKLKADYLRYFAEVCNEDDFPVFREKANENYEKAYELCKSNLPYHSPLFLSVALNYSIFIYTLHNDVRKAYDKADVVYKAAILKLNPDQKIPEVEVLIKAIEENLTIWVIELQDTNNY